MKIIGRKEEQQVMKSYQNDKNAHLLAVIGRRRVGKTFLIRQVYKNNKVFEMTGLKNASTKKQLLNFTFQMSKYFNQGDIYSKPESWLEAFNMLTKELENHKGRVKPVVFFDELPWIVSRKSDFMEALGHWWNNWASQQKIIVVVCGSAASWMLKHLVNAKGGLHNRITKLITLMPFTLNETKAFLEEKSVRFTDYQTIQMYLSIGGIPHYLNHISKGKSVPQNIQDLCFAKDGILKSEFDNLYPALFDNAKRHIEIIKALASKASGLNRQEILKRTKMSEGGWFSNILNELETSGFISTFEPLENKKKDMIYRLTDEYSLFYLTFMEGQSKSTNWSRISESQAYKIWCGYAFENLCIKHVDKIKSALQISGVQSSVNSYLHRSDSNFAQGFQIDMLIDRKDDIINICEMKFYSSEFIINKGYAQNIRTKKEGLKAVTKTKKMVHLTFITSYGVVENVHKLELIDNDYTISILFE
ncbi:AAA family ATPase [Psychroserpens ponticola]|uniref:ATP-binding protein n=1 Tax=Psychroserpens ponticola TaxID=2932268 RepID=A0ABY7S3E0_9FLAO|nr:ATP-binding protein [Psychroserpens ponticola]WCO02971.1 ATP-binding protein [Psychroserpens ponticola]